VQHGPPQRTVTAFLPPGTTVPSGDRRGFFPSGRFFSQSAPRGRGMELDVAQLLALLAAIVATLGSLVVLGLTAFVVSLAFAAGKLPRADGPRDL